MVGYPLRRFRYDEFNTGSKSEFQRTFFASNGGAGDPNRTCHDGACGAINPGADLHRTSYLQRYGRWRCRRGSSNGSGGKPYGVAQDGGNYGSNCQPYGCGTAFKLTRSGSGWVFSLLYTFPGGYDGSRPDSQLVFGPDGALYGSTDQGGIGHCGDSGTLPCGMIYRMAPPASFCKSFVCPWNVTVLYRFTGGADGGGPGEIVFDQAGSIYGPTQLGGQYGCSGYFCGTVFKLTSSAGGWTESVLYTFAGGSQDGYWPDGNLVFDQSRNIYGTTEMGGVEFEGTVYQLTPSQNGYTEKLLYQFTNGNSGQGPSGLLLDPSGDLFGTTFTGGLGGCGTAFELTPSNGNWVFLTPYSFSGGMGACGPFVGLIRDAAGNLYGTTNRTGAYGMGAVFKLTPSGYGWKYTSLHDFTGGSDGWARGHWSWTRAEISTALVHSERVTTATALAAVSSGRSLRSRV